MSELKVHARECDIERMVQIEELRAAFAHRLKKALEHKGIPSWGAGARLAKMTEVTPKASSKWLNGEAMPGGAKMAALAKGLGVRIEWLEYGRGEMLEGASASMASATSNAELLEPVSVWDDSTPLDDDEVAVPFLKEVELSAGNGRSAIEVSSSRRLRFGKYSLRNQGVDPDAARCVTVAGNSMEPVLRHGSTVGIDTSNTRVIDGDMYAIDHSGQLRIKQLYRLPAGGLRIRSFNRDEHPDEEYTAEQVRDQEIVVLGRVFWSGGFH